MLLAALAVATPASAQTLTGTWRNPGDSVRIKVAPCGRALCGAVVSASDKAKADAAAGGTPRLVGTQLFRGFVRSGEGWAGTVFVPDMDTEVAGTLRLDGRDVLVAEGCLIAGFACKQQRWTRVRAR